MSFIIRLRAAAVSFQSRLQRIAKVLCSDPSIGATSAMNADLFVPDLQPITVDFGKLRDSAAHFDQIAEDCAITNCYISMSTAAADFGK
jgi:hypothetical protein